MNERIKELANIWANRRAKDEKLGIVYTFSEPALEKFAELIVKECADLFVDQRYMVLNPLEPFANERVRALKEHDKDTVRKIKGHFGVEE